MSGEMANNVAVIASVCSAVMTAVYTIATIAICLANRRSADAADAQARAMRQQTDELLRQYRESIRARVSLRYGYDDAIGKYLIVKNVGKEDADDVRISINAEFLDGLRVRFKDSHLETLTKSAIHLASGQEFPVFVGFASQFDGMKTKRAEFTLHYRGGAMHYKETAVIDFSQYGFLSTITNTSIVDGKHIVEKLSVKG